MINIDNKIIVGITGRIGSGKSSVAGILAKKYGFIHIDVDKFGHASLEDEKDKLVNIFSDSILKKNGEINREKLGSIVFSDPEKLLLLNSITHQKMRDNIIDFVKNSSGRFFTLDAALLFKMKLYKICDYILAVETPDKNIIQRIKTSRHWEEEK